VQPRLQDVQLGLAHHATQAQQQAIVGVDRIINAIGITDEHVKQGTEFEELMPVLVGT
jgi:hypothetical protein